MAGLTPAAGTGRRDVNLLFSKEGKHGLALDAVLAEIQHLRHGGVRAVDDDFREDGKPLSHPLVQRTHSGVTALHVFGEPGRGRSQAHRVGKILGAGAHLALLLAAEVGRLERLHQTVTQVERADALGCVNLVSADRQGVDVCQLDGNAHPCLHCVNVDDGATVLLLDGSGQTLDVVPGANLVVYHHAGDKDGVFVHMRQHFVEVEGAVRLGVDDGDIVAHLCQTFQRFLDAGMLKAGHDDALAEVPGQSRAQQSEVVALAAAGGEVKLFRLAAQCPGDGGTGGIQRLLAPRAGCVEAGRVRPVFAHGFVNDVRHFRCDHRRGGVV